MKRSREHDTQQPHPKRLKLSTALEGIYAFGQNVVGAFNEWWNPTNPVQQPQQALQVNVVSEDKNIEADIAEPLSINPYLDTDILSEEQSHPVIFKKLDLSIEEKIENPVIVINEERNEFLRNRLFLTEPENPGLYREANQLFAKFEIDMLAYNVAMASDENANIQKPKHIHKPTIQLSHDGLALMSHLYAKKDNTIKQPLVVKTFDGFRKIVAFVDNSPNDVSLSLIVKFDSDFNCYDRKDVHRIAMKLEKINEEIHATYLDSVIQSNTLHYCSSILDKTISKNLAKSATEKTKCYSYSEKSIKEKPKRQNDGFQCTVFSTKDARQLNRESPLAFSKYSTQHPRSNDSYFYDVPPPAYLKGLQSRTYQESALEKFGDEVVTRKGLTLKEVYEKHPNQSYIPHFSKKYETLVMACANSLTDAQLNEAIGNYRAETITPERLQAVYGNKTVMKKA